MREIFAQHLIGVEDMFQVQTGVIEALKKQPLHYLVGDVSLESLFFRNKLEVITPLVQRHVKAFSDIHVLSRELISRLQSFGRLDELQLWEYRRAIVTQGDIPSVIFCQEDDPSQEMLDLRSAASSSGRTMYYLDRTSDGPHPWLRP